MVSAVVRRPRGKATRSLQQRHAEQSACVACSSEEEQRLNVGSRDNVPLVFGGLSVLQMEFLGSGFGKRMAICVLKHTKRVAGKKNIDRSNTCVSFNFNPPLRSVQSQLCNLNVQHIPIAEHARRKWKERSPTNLPARLTAFTRPPERTTRGVLGLVRVCVCVYVEVRGPRPYG